MNIKDKEQKYFYNGNFLIISNLISIVVVIILVFIIVYPKINKNNRSVITHDKSISYLLTNPILDCETNYQDSSTVIFSDKVVKKVDQIKDKYFIGSISLYYRDLNNGSWIGVEEKESFSPASLLKVPLLIQLLHEAEYNPSVLTKEVEVSPYDMNASVNQNIKFEDTLVVGKKYSLLKVAESMIDKSDNTAVSVILKNIDIPNISNVFNSVGVPFDDISKEVDVRVKDYAGFFRVLFNASYLNREMSEKALSILTKSEYNDGIVAGVPSNIVVAHKFGERTLSTEGENTKQLHDCGIIYYPDKPYIMCVMTRGNDLAIQGKAIKELSSYIYSEVSKQ